MRYFFLSLSLSLLSPYVLANLFNKLISHIIHMTATFVTHIALIVILSGITTAVE